VKSIKDLISTVDLAFLLTASSIYGYALFFCYSWGKFSFLKLPLTFIELDVKGLTVTALAITAVSTMIFVSMTTGKRLIGKPEKSGETKKKRKTPLFIVLTVYLILILAQIMFTGFYIEALLVVCIFPSLLVILVYLIIETKTYLYPIVSILILLLVGAFLMGRDGVKSTEEWYVIDNHKKQDYVILQPYKEQFIIAPVNLKKKTITPKFQIIDMKSENNKLEWQPMKTGKLEMKKY